jgi:hypothetical protein
MMIELHASFAIHPGPGMLKGIVKPHKMNVSSTAKHLKVTRPALEQIEQLPRPSLEFEWHNTRPPFHIRPNGADEA